MEENDTNYFSSPKFESVIDRYYTRLYKQVTPRMISALMGKDCDVENADTQCLDQYYFIHSNKLMLFGLSTKHEAIVSNAENPITEITYDINKKDRSKTQVFGKSKSKFIQTNNFIRH